MITGKRRLTGSKFKINKVGIGTLGKRLIKNYKAVNKLRISYLMLSGYI